MASCDEKQTLLNRYNTTTGTYASTVSELHAKMGILGRPDYERLRSITDGTRYLSEQARSELEAHVLDHGC
jgi:hypothetical protein